MSCWKGIRTYSVCSTKLPDRGFGLHNQAAGLIQILQAPTTIRTRRHHNSEDLVVAESKKKRAPEGMQVDVSVRDMGGKITP